MYVFSFFVFYLQFLSLILSLVSFLQYTLILITAQKESL